MCATTGLATANGQGRFENVFPSNTLFFATIYDVNKVQQSWHDILETAHTSKEDISAIRTMLNEQLPLIPTNMLEHYAGEIALGIPDAEAFFKALGKDITRATTNDVPLSFEDHLVFLGEMASDHDAFHNAQLTHLRARHSNETTTNGNAYAIVEVPHGKDTTIYRYEVTHPDGEKHIEEAWAYVDGVEISCRDESLLKEMIEQVAYGYSAASLARKLNLGVPRHEDALIYIDLPQFIDAATNYLSANDTLEHLTGFAADPLLKALNLDAVKHVYTTIDFTPKVFMAKTHVPLEKGGRLSELLLHEGQDIHRRPSFIPPEATSWTLTHIPEKEWWDTLRATAASAGPQMDSLTQAILNSIHEEIGFDLLHDLIPHLSNTFAQVSLDTESGTQELVYVEVANKKPLEKLIQQSKLNQGHGPDIHSAGTEHAYTWYSFSRGQTQQAYTFTDTHLVFSPTGSKALHFAMNLAQTPAPSPGSIPLSLNNILKLEFIQAPTWANVLPELLRPLPTPPTNAELPSKMFGEAMNYTHVEGNALVHVRTILFASDIFRSTEKSK